MNYVKELQLKSIIREALNEDIGRKDITTEAIIPKNKFVKAVLVAKEDCVVCGLHIAGLVFKLKDKNIKFKPQVKDGQNLKKGKVLAEVLGRAQSILIAERVALNFVSLLSGIATSTKEYVERVKPYKVKIMDTRKTIPGLRELEKYAVRIGGGYNHRMRLDEIILIKDNHWKVTGSYLNLPKFTENYQVELEVKNLKEFIQALKLKPDIIMLDNMSIKDMKKAVKIRNHLRLILRQAQDTSWKDTERSRSATYDLRLKLEASGGITLKNVKKIASTGVDMISIGALTHSVNSVDISLEIL